MEDKAMTLIRRKNDLLPNVFDSFFNDDFFQAPVYQRVRNNMPAVNIRETEDDFQLELAVPGFGKNDFHVEFENNRLTISSKKEENQEENQENGYRRREFAYSSFERSFTVDEKSINSDKINAKYENGILLVTLPKREEVKPKPARMIKIA